MNKKEMKSRVRHMKYLLGRPSRDLTLKLYSLLDDMDAELSEGEKADDSGL
jgi:hypothetical protein